MLVANGKKSMTDPLIIYEGRVQVKGGYHRRASTHALQKRMFFIPTGFRVLMTILVVRVNRIHINICRIYISWRTLFLNGDFYHARVTMNGILGARTVITVVCVCCVLPCDELAARLL